MFFRSQLNTVDVIAFTRNLSATLHAGVPIIESLRLFEEKGWRPRQRVIRHVRNIVEAGQSLSDAMDTSPYTFPQIAVNLVRAGEQEGNLEENLEYVSNYLRNSDQLKRKIQRAMVYPGFVLFTLVALILAIGMFVLPQILPLFQSLNIELQFTTRILLGMGVFFQEHGVYFSLGVIGSIAVFMVLIRTRLLRSTWHRFLLRVPYVRTIQQHSAISQMGRTMGTLLHSGVPIRDAIEATSTIFSNKVYSRIFLQASDIVESGLPLSDAIEQHPRLFPKMAIALVRIGEETGSLSESMEYLSNLYDEKVDYAIKDFTTVLEPLLLMFIGTVVGFVVYSIVVPIYQITDTIR